MKNFEPTERKIQKEKEKGNLFKLEITKSTLAVFFTLLLIYLLINLADTSFFQPSQISPKDLLKMSREFTVTTLALIASQSLVSILFDALINKGIWLRKEKRFGVFSNIKSFFTQCRRALLSLWYMLLFVIIVFIHLGSLQISSYPAAAWSLVLVLLALLFLAAVIEIVVERIYYLRSLRMDLKEIKDEFKETEGDPLIKAELQHQHKVMLYEEIKLRLKSTKVIVVG
jgi:flagellar biosynthesis protein FlhB